MRRILPLRNLLAQGLGTFAMLVTLAGLPSGSAQTQDRDPVQALKQALDIRVADVTNMNEMSFRKAAISRRLAALRTIAEMRRALTLQEWKDTDRDLGPLIDRPLRAELANRLAQGLRDVLQYGPFTSKLAAVTLIGEMGVTTRDVEPATTSYARRFAPDLIALVRGPNATLSAAAARSLGRITPEPGPAARALGSLFSTGDLTQRAAAADGLNSMVRVIATLVRGRSPTGIEVSREDVAQVGEAVVPSAGLGIRDPNTEVRRLNLETLQNMANLLGDQVQDPKLDLPPQGRKLTKEELGRVEDYRSEVLEERKVLLPVARALADQAPKVAAALSDPEVAVRVQAARALELMGFARQRLERRAASARQTFGEARRPEPRPAIAAAGAEPTLILVAAEQADKGAIKPFTEDPLGSAMRRTLPELAASVRDPDVRVRLAAVDVLETLPADLAPAAPALVAALADCDRFVRWAAARTLGKAAEATADRGHVPTAADTAIPGLIRLLADPDLGVRIQGADFALQRYGSYAAAAVPTLARSVGQGDAESRVAAINTLVDIGPAAEPAVPAIAAALSDSDVRVRRSAATGLGRLGVGAAAAVAALRQALYDQDDEVRRAASEALLSIEPVLPRK